MTKNLKNLGIYQSRVSLYLRMLQNTFSSDQTVKGQKERTSDELEEILQRFIFRAYLTTDVDFQFKISGNKKKKKKDKKHSRKLWYLP